MSNYNKKKIDYAMIQYTIDQKLCTFCGGCSAVCPEFAIEIYDDKSEITEACINCGLCECFCPVSAIKTPQDRD